MYINILLLYVFSCYMLIKFQYNYLKEPLMNHALNNVRIIETITRCEVNHYNPYSKKYEYFPKGIRPFKLILYMNNVCSPIKLIQPRSARLPAWHEASLLRQFSTSAEKCRLQSLHNKILTFIGGGAIN